MPKKVPISRTFILIYMFSNPTKQKENKQACFVRLTKLSQTLDLQEKSVGFTRSFVLGFITYKLR